MSNGSVVVAVVRAAADDGDGANILGATLTTESRTS